MLKFDRRMLRFLMWLIIALQAIRLIAMTFGASTSPLLDIVTIASLASTVLIRTAGA